MADSLFEGLGFEKFEAYNYILYSKETQSIIFNLREKRVEFGYNIVDCETMQAVTEKIKELRWY